MSFQITVLNWDKSPVVRDYEEAQSRYDQYLQYADTVDGADAGMVSEMYKRDESGKWYTEDHEAPYVDFPRALRGSFEAYFNCTLYDEDSGCHRYPQSDEQRCSAIALYKFIQHCETHLMSCHLNNLKVVLEYMIENPQYTKFQILG